MKYFFQFLFFFLRTGSLLTTKSEGPGAVAPWILFKTASVCAWSHEINLKDIDV